MGIFDTLLTKPIREEKNKAGGKQTKAKGKTARKTSSEKSIAQQVVLRAAELERQEGALKERERLLNNKEGDLDKLQKEVEDIKKKEVSKLEKISSLTKKEARDLILSAMEKKIADDVARRIKEGKDEVKAIVDEKAKELFVEAIQHGATDWVAEYTVSSIHLPDEDMKGRIIGREGRNIRTFERATGVEIEIDETNDIRLSSFDSVRREIARRSIEKLVKDRRIQPSRIEEVVEKTKKEVIRSCLKKEKNFVMPSRFTDFILI